jgi:HSP20 family protein
MAIVKWEQPFEDFDRWFFNDMVPAVRAKGGFDLSMDVYEDGNNIIAEMQVPGIAADKLNVYVKDGYLHVSGNREETRESKDKQHFVKEIRRGAFERSVRLPVTVDAKKVTADYKGGILKITLPKTDVTEGIVKVNIAKE